MDQSGYPEFSATTIGASILSELDLPDDGPLIMKTLEKPFLPGHQVLALYDDHVVFAIVQGSQEFPEEILGPGGAKVWSTFDRARKVLVLPHAEVEWIKSHERCVENGSAIKITFLFKKMKKSVLLPEKEGAIALTSLAEKFGDKLDPTVDSAVDVQHYTNLITLLICLLLDGWLAWALWDLWNNNAITGPRLIVDFMWLFYESRGFATTATLSIVCVALFNWLMLVVCLSKSPPRTYTLNCSNCGYQLRGLTSKKCPECGTKIESAK